MTSVQFFPLILWYFMFGIKILIFWEKQFNSRLIFLYAQEFFLAKSLQKTCLYVHEKLERNPFVGSCLKIFILWPYGFDDLGFLANIPRGAMSLKTQWFFYRDLDWWPGPQKVQFWEITGYPDVVGLILALLSSWNFWFCFCFTYTEVIEFR